LFAPRSARSIKDSQAIPGNNGGSYKEEKSPIGIGFPKIIVSVQVLKKRE
jgi:hypothetical protein